MSHLFASLLVVSLLLVSVTACNQQSVREEGVVQPEKAAATADKPKKKTGTEDKEPDCD